MFAYDPNLPTIRPKGRPGWWYVRLPNHPGLPLRLLQYREIIVCLHERFREEYFYCQPCNPTHDAEKTKQAARLRETSYVCMTIDQWYGPERTVKRLHYTGVFEITGATYDKHRHELRFTFVARVANCFSG